MAQKRIKTFFDGEGAMSKKQRVYTEDDWRAFKEKHPEGPPQPKRRSTCERPQRSLYAFYVRQSTTEAQIRDVFGLFGEVTDVILCPEENGVYVVFRKFADAKEAKNHLDLQTTYSVGKTLSSIDFILRRVEKQTSSEGFRLRLDKPHDKLRVDYRRVPDNRSHLLAVRRSSVTKNGPRMQKCQTPITSFLTPVPVVEHDESRDSLDDPILDGIANDACLLPSPGVDENSLDSPEVIEAANAACDWVDDFWQDIDL